MATAKKRFGKRLVRGVLYAIAAFLLLSISCVLVMRWIDPVTSAFILHARVAAKFNDDKKFSVHQQWMPLKKISPAVQLAVIASEDQKFPEHWGFDFESIADAVESREHGGRLRGASTISQQVAKNLFLWGGQNFFRKGLEAYFTVLLETLWPKHRILEVYLNVAQFGHGIYGVEAASRIYFGKHAARLSNEEAALLAAVLPNPLRLKVSAPSAYVRSRQTWIVSQMAGLGGTRYLHTFN